MFNLRTLLIAIPSLPLAAAILTPILGPKFLRGRSHWFALVAIAGSFICSCLLLNQVREGISNSSGSQIGFEHVETLWTWASIGDARQLPDVPAGTTKQIGPIEHSLPFRMDVALRADALTGIMLCMVTMIATLVVVYAAGYMHGDRSYWRFFTYVSLFVFSMTMLVLVSNFLLLFVFWEAVGACSYLLIGFWYEKPEAASAGKKAFLVNRVGDFGFALALFLIWLSYGTLNYHDTADVWGVFGQARLSGEAAFVTGGTATAICLLLMLGACGKSAQFPLHVWLPDAMEGPTPVSALIHAATMVTAGVYMVTRCTPLFMVSPDAQLTVACIGGFTALMAGLIAMTQTDLKRVLAYSTVSQLGYMFLSLGTGTMAGIAAGMFHLFTHAFFKALLFLGAGSVMHSMGHVIDMRRFSGLRRIMPITCATFAVGSLALAGIPPLSGFFSKDAILGAVHDRIHEAEHALTHTNSSDAARHHGESPSRHDASEHVESGSHPTGDANVSHGVSTASVYSAMTPEHVSWHARLYRLLYAAGLVTAFLTSFYSFRAFFMTFYGPEVIPDEAGDHAHESPQVMWVPLAILSVFAVFVGFVIHLSGEHVWFADEGEPNGFAALLAHTPSLASPIVRATTQPGTFHWNVAITSSLIAFLGLGVSAFLYLGNRREIAWLTYVCDFGWLRGVVETPWMEVLGKQPLFATIQGIGERLGVGWLPRLLGYIGLLLIGIVCSPLLIGYFLSPLKLSQHKFYWDEIYDWTIVRPFRALGQVFYALDRWLVDGLVNVTGQLPVWTGGGLRRLQGGLLPFYGLAMALGTFALLLLHHYWN